MIKRQVITLTFLALGTLVAPKYPSLAQTSPSTTPQEQSSPSITAPTTSSLNAVDKKFMLQAADGGMAEVEFAQLALQKASSDTVKDYAQRMINEHKPANEQLMSLAEQKGVTLPTAISAKNQAIEDKLSKLSGASFDKMYISQAGVSAHTQQAALYKQEIKAGKDSDVKAFASQVLPTVQEHLQMARTIASTKMSGMTTTPR